MMYTIEAERLRPAFGTLLAGIEHVGSTAVPGLAAKPIIDILIAVGSWEGFDDLKNRLGTLGYEFTPLPDTDGVGCWPSATTCDIIPTTRRPTLN